MMFRIKLFFLAPSLNKKCNYLCVREQNLKIQTQKKEQHCTNYKQIEKRKMKKMLEEMCKKR